MNSVIIHVAIFAITFSLLGLILVIVTGNLYGLEQLVKDIVLFATLGVLVYWLISAACNYWVWDLPQTSPVFTDVTTSTDICAFDTSSGENTYIYKTSSGRYKYTVNTEKGKQEILAPLSKYYINEDESITTPSVEIHELKIENKWLDKLMWEGENYAYYTYIIFNIPETDATLNEID